MQELWIKNKMMVIAVVIVAVLLVGGGTYMLLGKKQTPSSTSNIPDQTQQTATVPTLAPSDIGMSLAVTRNGESVTMTVTKLDGITALDYEVTYTANSNGNQVPRGVIGHIDVKPGQSQINQEVVLGTCSDVCHYDKVVSPVKFGVKVTKSDGKVYEVDQSINLSQ